MSSIRPRGFRIVFSATILASLLLSSGTSLLAAEAKLDAKKLTLIEQAMPKAPTVAPKRKRKLLVYTNAVGFVHSSIPYGAKAMEIMGRKSGAFEATVTNDPAAFEWDNLKQYDAVCFISTTGNSFMKGKVRGQKGSPYKNKEEEKMYREREPRLQKNLMEFVKSGKGWAGFHASSDSYYKWVDYGRMVGGYFWGHPWHEDVMMKVDDPTHPLTRVFKGGSYLVKDEIYQFRDPYSRENLRVLLSLDTKRTNMKKKGINRKDDDHAVAWIREWGKGRVFYSSLGHRDEIFWNPMVMDFYLDGLQYALGDLEADATPTAKASIKSKPSPADALPEESLTGLNKGSNGVKMLFDGSNLDQWDFKKGGWVVEDGVMAIKGRAGTIWSKERFGNFVLDLEFKMSPKCNSGVFVRTNDRKEWLHSGMEIQILDTDQVSTHSSGALYDCLAPSENAVKPAGEWNRYVITCNGSLIRVVLNGKKVVDTDLNKWTQPSKNPDGKKNKFRWAYKDMWRDGYISFQDHGHPVWFRNVMIKPLP